MHYTITALLGLLFLTATLQAQQAPTTPAKDQLFADYSYAYGMLMAKSFTMLQLAPNEENRNALVKGIQKAVAGVTPEEMAEIKTVLKDHLNPNLEEPIASEVDIARFFATAVTTKFYVGLGQQAQPFDYDELRAGFDAIAKGETPRLTEEASEAALSAYLTPDDGNDDEETVEEKN